MWAAWPNWWTINIALVLFVIFFSNLSGLIVNVSGSISTKINFAPDKIIILAGAIKVKLGQIISSPFFKFNDLIAKWSAVVQLEVDTQYFTLWYLAIEFSNSLTKLPWLEIQFFFKQ